jgi:hypothetical protein
MREWGDAATPLSPARTFEALDAALERPVWLIIKIAASPHTLTFPTYRRLMYN